VDGLLSDVLHGRARFDRLKTFAAVVEQSVHKVASRDDVKHWLLGLIRARLEGRAHVLRSRMPIKPSGEIPLVQVPTDLDTARFAARIADASTDTEQPPPLPTMRTPQPFPGEEEAFGGPPSSIRAAQSLESEPTRRPSSIPPSSIRSTQVTPPVPADPNRRAPLESALAEFVERGGGNGRKS
jgi:hypothetical protein